MRRLVLGAVLILTGCGTSARTAKNPAPTDSAPPQVRQVKVGTPVVLSGYRLRMAVKVTKVVPTATGKGAFGVPRKGERFTAVRFVLKNVGDTAYHDSPTFGATVVDESGHGYDPTVAAVTAGRGFPRAVSLPRGRSRAGYVVFAVPKKARIVSVRYALNAGSVGEWVLR